MSGAWRSALRTMLRVCERLTFGREQPSRDKCRFARLWHTDLPLNRVQILRECRLERARSSLHGSSAARSGRQLKGIGGGADLVTNQMVNGWAGGGVRVRGPATAPGNHHALY